MWEANRCDGRANVICQEDSPGVAEGTVGYVEV